MTTPAVVVESTADTLVRSPQLMLARVTFSELHSLRSMMPLPLPPETAVELTERQLGAADSIGSKGFGCPCRDKDPFPQEACFDSGAFASPRFVRLAGTNKTTRAMIAVTSSARLMLRFMRAIFSLTPCPLREEPPAVHALAGARLNPFKSCGGVAPSPVGLKGWSLVGKTLSRFLSGGNWCGMGRSSCLICFGTVW